MKYRWIIGLAITVILFSSCNKSQEKNVIRLGCIAGAEEQLMESAKRVAYERFGLKVKIVTFSSYMLPNAALNDGSIDANVFQTIPFLEEQIRAKGYQIQAIAKTFIYPMALYSKKINTLSDLPKNARVAIPNDPSNEGRALLLLQSAGLIELKSAINYFSTPSDVIDNPHNLQFVVIDAAQLPRVLSDVEMAAINTTYALPAGLDPGKSSLFTEKPSSPYANVLVVREEDARDPKFVQLIEALHSEAVLETAQRIFGSAAIPAWKDRAKNVLK